MLLMTSIKRAFTWDYDNHRFSNTNGVSTPGKVFGKSMLNDIIHDPVNNLVEVGIWYIGDTVSGATRNTVESVFNNNLGDGNVCKYNGAKLRDMNTAEVRLVLNKCITERQLVIATPNATTIPQPTVFSDEEIRVFKAFEHAIVESNSLVYISLKNDWVSSSVESWSEAIGISRYTFSGYSRITVLGNNTNYMWCVIIQYPLSHDDSSPIFGIAVFSQDLAGVTPTNKYDLGANHLCLYKKKVYREGDKFVTEQVDRLVDTDPTGYWFDINHRGVNHIVQLHLLPGQDDLTMDMLRNHDFGIILNNEIDMMGNLLTFLSVGEIETLVGSNWVSQEAARVANITDNMYDCAAVILLSFITMPKMDLNTIFDNHYNLGDVITNRLLDGSRSLTSKSIKEIEDSDALYSVSVLGNQASAANIARLKMILPDPIFAEYMVGNQPIDNFNDGIRSVVKSGQIGQFESRKLWDITNLSVTDESMKLSFINSVDKTLFPFAFDIGF